MAIQGSTRPRLLITDGLYETGLKHLQDSGVFDIDLRNGVSGAELLEIIGEYDGLVIHVQTKLPAALLRAGRPRLRFVGCASAGFDHVDIDAAKSAGIEVRAATGANAGSVGDLAVGFMLGLLRRFNESGEKLRSGGWDRKALSGQALSERRLGILGVGNTGRATALRAAAFGVPVFGYDPLHKAGTRVDGVVEMLGSREEVLDRVDMVSVHVPFSAETKYLLGEEQLRRLPRGSYVINTARGGIVEEDAMKRCLDDGHIAGYGVDVFETEPLPVEHWARTHRAVLATPHLGGATSAARHGISMRIAQETIDFFSR
jgi:D-3-phosphoglycerate dehydrogenase